MSETGLIVAEVVFLALLYAFVWAVVRSSSRALRATQPTPPAAPPPEHEPAVRAAAPPPAPPLAEPVASPHEEVPAPTIGPPAVASNGDASSEARTEIPSESGRFDLAANLHPRLIVEASPSLDAEREIELTGGMTIGRSDAAGLSIADAFVSHMHARIMRRGAYYYVEDLGSTNGTFLNDRRVERDAQLKVHDSLRIGQTTLRYEE
jgi:hypothetical protein